MRTVVVKHNMTSIRTLLNIHLFLSIQAWVFLNAIDNLDTQWTNTSAPIAVAFWKFSLAPA